MFEHYENIQSHMVYNCFFPSSGHLTTMPRKNGPDGITCTYRFPNTFVNYLSPFLTLPLLNPLLTCQSHLVGYLATKISIFIINLWFLIVSLHNPKCTQTHRSISWLCLFPIHPSSSMGVWMWVGFLSIAWMLHLPQLKDVFFLGNFIRVLIILVNVLFIFSLIFLPRHHKLFYLAWLNLLPQA